MRVAIASTFLGQMPRGVESWARDLAAELYRRKYDVTLFKGGGAADLPYERQLRCTNHTAPIWERVTRWTRHGGWRIGLGSPLTLQQTTFGMHLIPELRRGRYDIVHMQDADVARIAERARRLKLHPAKVILGHGTEESFDFLRHFEHVQELAPHYLELDRQRGLPSDHQWFAIPNFVDGEQFCPGDRAVAREKFGIPSDRFVVLEVAAVKLTHKRIDWLVNEVAELRRTQPNALLIVAGATTPETPQVERIMRDQLGEHGRLLMNLKRSDMPDLYRTADVFAHPSLREMLGIVFLEAMASGVPCLGHQDPVTEWVIGRGGATVDMERTGALAAALARLAGDSELRARPAVAARQHVLDNFETNRVVDQILAMYETVLGRHG